MSKAVNFCWKFVKNNFVFVIALVIAGISCAFVPFDKGYLDYFDWKTLACILSLLIVIAGLSRLHFFEIIAKFIVKKFKNSRSIIMCLIFITYFSALINANDMALLTFLPLSYIVLKYTNNLKYVPFTFVMQNIASNLGGMITPIGNPQNLFIYSYYQIPLLEFMKIMLPSTLISLVLIIIVCLFIKKTPLKYEERFTEKLDPIRSFIYIILFAFVVLSVVGVIPWWISLIVCVAVMLGCDGKALLKVDYTVPLIFVCFFIFSGNMARIQAVMNAITSLVNKNVFFTSYISCQLISNVPTAVLLSRFTTNYAQLLVSVNVASLGIIFSSLSGVIALKEYAKVARKENLSKNRGIWYYVGIDTLFNVVGAIILVPLSYLFLII